MQPFINPESTIVDAVGNCMHCGKPGITAGKRGAVCSNCRARAARFTIPPWLKIPGMVVVLLLAGFVCWRTGVASGRALANAKKAFAQQHYVTAQQLLRQYLSAQPNSAEAHQYLAMCAFYNQDYPLLFGEVAKIADQKNAFPADALQGPLAPLVAKAIENVPPDSLNNLLHRYGDKAEAVPDSVYRHFLEHNNAYWPVTRLRVTAFMAKENYTAADSLLDIALTKDTANLGMLRLKVYVKQELSQTDSALYYCDRILSINPESAAGLAPKARILLRRGKKQEGLQLAMQSYTLNNNDGYSMATLAIAYHLNKKFAERDQLVAEAQHDSTKADYMEYAIDVFTGREQFSSR